MAERSNTQNVNIHDQMFVYVMKKYEIKQVYANKNDNYKNKQKY